MSSLYGLIEPALVGGGVLVALGFALRRFVPGRRSAAGGCAQCSGCGACGSAVASTPDSVKPIVFALSSPRRRGSTLPGFPPARE